MPLVRIDLIKGKSDEYRLAVGDAVYRALLGLGAPADDQFQIIEEHDPGDFIYAPRYLGIERSDDLLIIQITLVQGRSVEMKRDFYKALVDELQGAVAIRREDVFINLVEVAKENWSFGSGVAQYASDDSTAPTRIGRAL